MSGRADRLADPLADRGWSVVDGLLEDGERAALRSVVDALLAARTDEERRAHAALGSLVPVWRDPRLAVLFAHPRILAALASCGVRGPRATGGYVFDKPPGAPRTHWHHDWMFWNDDVSARAFPPQVGVMCALTDSTLQSGCLRVLPGSQRRRHALHDALASSDRGALRRGDDPAALPFASFDDETAIPLAAGSAVVLDARLLHAAHANRTAAPRTIVTLWYLVDDDGLDPGTVAAFADVAVPAGWPDDVRRRLEPVMPRIPVGVVARPVDGGGPR